MAKLTKPQREFLERVSRETMNDNSGRGLRIYDGHEMRMAERLHGMGFVTMPQFCTAFAGPKITATGRLALTGNQETDGAA